MKQQFFEQSYQAQWEQLERILDADKKLSKAQIAEFPVLYRQACRHLALSRERRYAPYLVQRLNHLVLRAHQRFYSARENNSWERIMRFILWTLPAQVRAEGRYVAASALLFFGPMLIMALDVYFNPLHIYSLLNADQVTMMEAMYEPGAEHVGREREAESDLQMFGFYIRNNIGIAFQTFAGGILFCIGSVFFLMYNGLYIGAVGGHLVQIGYYTPFFSFVSGHSGLELGGIVLAGAAGLKIGMALTAPGRFGRLHALRKAAREALPLIYGFILMLTLAAFVEAFWSSKGQIDPLVKYQTGALLLLLILLYFSLAGRGRAAG